MAKDDGYSLDRYPGETERLNMQNQLFNRIVGYVLHPIIHKKLAPEPKVAEIATGTGAWLVDLSKELTPNAQLDGYDISDYCFLPKEELPGNVSLSRVDAREPVFVELRGKYDVVNIRFINIAMPTPEDWKAVASHAAQLLKPGGAIQWIEGDLLQLGAVLRSSPEVKTETLERAFNQTLRKLQYLRWFIDNLGDILRDVGFGDVRHDVAIPDRIPEDPEVMTIIAVGAMHSILRRQTQMKVEGAPTEVELEEWRDEMMRETKGGAYMRADFHQFVAFKKE